MFNLQTNASGGSKIAAILDSMIVLNRTFYDVTKIEIGKPYLGSPFPYQTFLFWDKGTGTIRKEINDTINGYQVWNLKNESLIK